MDCQIIWALKAAENLEAICDFIAQDSIYYASLTAEKILNLIDNLSSFPESGRIVPEYNDKQLREIIYKNYRIVYRFKGEIIEIAAITHTARKALNL